ncbi:hypothetical protein L6R49_22255 [Myxococcota bacterium]|nr:hypothetical protein [Myxococcota bacterium]
MGDGLPKGAGGRGLAAGAPEDERAAPRRLGLRLGVLWGLGHEHRRHDLLLGGV